MNEEENLKEVENLNEEISETETVETENVETETMEMDESKNVDCQEKECDEDCCRECTGEVNTKINILKSLEAICIDQIIIFILSAVGTVLLNLILFVFGYSILNPYYIVFVLIVYVPLSILYPFIMEACIGNTLGRKICKLKISKAE
jgi:hypothetical protein